jgi:predicted TIM-barrel fold metal-dependent hydrolase
MSQLERSISRRNFSMSSALAIAMASAPAILAQPQEAGNWIDAHVHVWTPDTQKYPLAPAFKIADMQPASFTPQELFAHCRPVGVRRVVLIQMNFYEYDNRYMTDMIAQHPGTFSGVAIVDHRTSGLADRMQELSQKGVRGFRIYWHQAAEWATDDSMLKFWKLAGEQNLAICPLINPEDIQHVETMCKKFPETKVVVDHFARIGVSGKIEEPYLKSLCDLARHPQVFVKTSAFYALGMKQAPYADLAPMIRQVRDAFGAQRLMWASDCPFQVQGEHNY